jgi:hypothetical protein
MARADIGVGSIAVSQSVVAFTAFLPNFVEIGRSEKETVEGEVRLGELAAVVIALSIGALLSWMAESTIPFMISAFMSFVLITMYEVALRKDV